MMPRAYPCLVVATLLVGLGCPRPPVAQVPTGLAGMVVAEGAEGVGVGAAEVVLRVDPEGARIPLAKGKTGADGRFSLTNVPDGTYWLALSSPSLVEQIVRVKVDGATGRELGRLVLEKSRSLTGSVVDRQESPVPLAHVLVFAGGGTDGVPMRKLTETRADLEGRFGLSGLGRGPYRVLIEAPGLGAAEIPEALVTSDSVRITIDAETGKVSGTVLEQGRPVPGADLWLYGELLADARDRGADEQGRFVFGGLGPGRYAVLARSGHRVSRPSLVTIDEALTPLELVTLALEPGEVLVGRVQDGQGQPVKGAKLLLSEIRPGFFPLTTPLDVTPSGAFSSPALYPGRYRVTVQAPGFVTSRDARVEIVAGQRPAPLTLLMGRESKVKGRALDRAGLPLEAAVVRLLRPGFDQLGILTRTLPPAAEAAATVPSARFDATARVQGTRSDAIGHFSFEAVAQGPFRLEIIAPGHAPWRSPILSLGPGQELDQGDLKVP